MKKLLAIILTIAMMLSLMVVVPMAAEEGDVVYLDIVNHDFEADEAGTTGNAITGWTAAETSTAVVKGISGFGGSKGIEEARDAANAISQIIEIPADLSAEIDKYSWSFEARTLYATYLKVQMLNAEQSVLATGDFNSFDSRSWSAYTAKFDITDTVAEVELPKYMKITLSLHAGQGGAFDDIRISATRLPDRDIQFGDPIKFPLVNRGFEASAVGDSSVLGAASSIAGWEGTSNSAGWTVGLDGNGKFISGGKTTKIKQTVELSEGLASLLGAYNWTFTAKVVYCVYMDVTLYNADKSQSVTTSLNTFDGRNGAFHTVTLDLTEAFSKMKNAKYVELAFWGHGNGLNSYYDIDIRGEVKPLSASMIANSNFEEVDENGALVNWEFANVGEATQSDLVFSNASEAMEGTGYIKLPAGGRAETQIDTVVPGKAYVLEVSYKQLGSDAFITVEDIANSYNKLTEVAVGAATGTTEADMVWNTYKYFFVVPATANKGIFLRLRNGFDENAAYYDRIVLSEVNGFDKDELIINGNFDINYGSGSTTLIGSFQPHNGAPATIVAAADGILHTGAGVAAIARVNVNDYDYVNQKNFGYKFTVEFDYGGGGIPGMWFRARFADGTEVSQDVAFVRRNNTDPVPDNLDPKTQMDVILWQKQIITYDLTWMTQSTTSPVVGIDIQLKGGGVEAKWDDASLRCLRDDIDIVNADGNERTGIITESAGTYKVVINKLTPEDAGALAWVCVYNVDANGVKRLVKAVNGAADADVKVENLDTVSGQTVVKAFILGSNMEWYAAEEIK